MALPDLIEIVPLDKPVRAEITVPGSKSITNRALVLAALADGETTLTGALWSEDTQVMVECLQELGFMVNVAPEPNESCNRTITVYGKGGEIPRGGTGEHPLELFVGNAGTAARFLAAMVCLGSGAYRLHGVPRMHERPQAALFKALRELGYRVDAAGDKLPAVVHGGGARSGANCTVSIEQSSQFASALLLCAGQGGWDVKIVGENAEESPYVAMTTKLIAAFPKRGGRFQIEPDASSGSYFWGAGSMKFLNKELRLLDFPNGEKKECVVCNSEPTVKVAAWPRSGWQMDEQFLKFYYYSETLTRNYLKSHQALDETAIAQKVEEDTLYGSELTVSRQVDLGDSIMTAIVISPFLIMKHAKFTNVGRLRVQECERVEALRTELTKCGAKVVEEGDTLTVYPAKPGELHGAEIETYNDHRMAMCFAILGLKVPGIRIKNPACVKKTFPNFFQKLAALPPHGLGAEIWEVKAGQRTRKLSGEDLFAA